MDSFPQITVPTENFSVVCRLCLTVHDKLVHLFPLQEIETLAVNLPMKITMCTTIKMSRNDMLPHKICHDCLNYINGWYQFRGKCKLADTVLKKFVSEKTELEAEKKFKYFDIDLSVPGIDDQFDDLLEPNLPASDISESEKDIEEEPTFTDLDRCQPYPVEPPTIETDLLNSTNNEPMLRSRKKRHQCSECPDSFYFLKDLKQHQTILHENGPSEQKITKTDEPIERNLKKSYRVKKKAKIEEPNEKPRYVMNCCGKVFYSKAMFSRHYKKYHPGEKPYMCDLCGKKDFISEETLKRHKVLHSGKFRCDICSKTFTCNAILLIHKRDKHEDDKPFVCDVCGKRFVTELLMNYHKRFHSGEKKYVCEECGLAVVTSSSLSKHRRIHNMVKPHVCEVCGKGFIIKGRLIEHLRGHTGEKPFTCEVCQKGFTMRDKLRRHVRIHSGEKHYSCEYCGNNYSTGYGLSVHRRTHIRHL